MDEGMEWNEGRDEGWMEGAAGTNEGMRDGWRNGVKWREG